MRARPSLRSCLAASLAVALLGSISCSGRTPLVPTGPRPAADPPPLAVEDPPPSTRVEILPLRRNSKCYWRGGYWRPSGDGWQWEKGAWVEPVPGCVFAPPVTGYEPYDGGTRLVYRPGVWYRPRGTGTCLEARDCTDL